MEIGVGIIPNHGKTLMLPPPLIVYCLYLIAPCFLRRAFSLHVCLCLSLCALVYPFPLLPLGPHFAPDVFPFPLSPHALPLFLLFLSLLAWFLPSPPVSLLLSLVPKK